MRLRLPSDRLAETMPLVIFFNGSVPCLRTAVQNFIPADEGIWVRDNDGTPMVKDILAPVLGFFICYDHMFNYHPTLFDSLVVTYWGEIKFFSTKLVNKVKVDDKESKQNIRDLIEWINSMTSEGELAETLFNIWMHMILVSACFVTYTSMFLSCTRGMTSSCLCS